MASLNIILFWSSLIRRKTDWSESKTKTKLVAMRNKKKKRPPQIVLTGPKRARNFLNLLKFVKMFKKNLVSFEPTTFSLRLTLFLPKTNSHFNRFFLKLNSIDNSQKKKSENFDFAKFSFYANLHSNCFKLTLGIQLALLLRSHTFTTQCT